ncbi:DUF3141 domain-containing protein [Jannaschia helgolandensis]|uniref:Poly(3-hydroxyalkanoate) synthetase n=1 Tax=Jannaschia helgolandensis TaxID=188906 RepID=A0A1H7LP69_9RHOB|nr:DUF3141 domain-containing protein [Jannaschia helgolandensis]SEL00187.1 Protein of unknown function [Jannaschia helgolandensis]
MNIVTPMKPLIAANTEAASERVVSTHAPPDPLAYGRDLWERSVLFLDTLRQRADNMIAHDRAGMPPLLDFKYETLLDARQFERPANYALLRVTEVDGNCWDDCVDAAKPPVIVVDPRAGHGPGIGGFKRDSEVGMAMAEGHPVYFVIFFPEPEPDQTLEAVLFALRRFVEEVAARHDDTAPVLYGNCQAGWAVVLLAAHCEGLAGPVVLNGSPLSYWAGEEGVNPMRISGGLLGGAWLAHLTADLGDGRFDGAWLAQNFESLKPEKAIWEKYANLLENVDTERDRFLEFERWWNGFYTLSRPEILSITQNLFIGNRLESGEMPIGDHCVADLRKIKSPVIVFASYGDNITPPAQALGWIPVVYKDTADLKAAGQRIVYLTNDHVGHLGIFVSASVAKLEHRAILESLGRIEKLKPGLYEMKIDNPSGDPDCHAPHYKVRFEPRKISDLDAYAPDRGFDAARRASEINEAFYATFVSPWVQLMTTPASAEMMKWMHPMRTSRLMFSERFNPWMRLVRQAADNISGTREPLDPNDPMILRERAAIKAIGKAIERARIDRDAKYERAFKTLYGGETSDIENDPHMPV